MTTHPWKNSLHLPVQVWCISSRGTATEYPHVSNNKPDGKETIQGHLEVVKQRINPADGMVHSSLMHSHFAACIINEQKQVTMIFIININPFFLGKKKGGVPRISKHSISCSIPTAF